MYAAKTNLIFVSKNNCVDLARKSWVAGSCDDR